MRIFEVLHVSVTKVSESPLVLSIQANGLTATSGWTNPRLDNSADPNPDDAVLEFSFDADKPTGISLPRLTPVMTSVDFTPSNGADAVIVSARTNSVTVHASEFLKPGEEYPQISTRAIGEEGPLISTQAIGEEGPQVSTRATGEEGPPTVTTQAIGEEGPQVSTRATGEEGPPTVTTQAIGEEGPEISTRATGEEGPPTVTTFALGEEGPEISTRATGEEGPPTVTTQAIGEESSPFGSY